MINQMFITFDQSQVVLDPQKPRIFVGRDAKLCALHTDDPSVSRQHAEIFADAGNVYLTDLGSSNGTWVNGIPVRRLPVPVAPGQQIYVGRVPLIVGYAQQQAAPAAGDGQKTMFAAPPDALNQYMQQRAAIEAQPSHLPTGYQANAQGPQFQPGAVTSMPVSMTPAAAPTNAQVVGLGGKAAPLPAEYAYRRQGSNSNGALLIALKSDTFANNAVIDGYLEYTALDNETINYITIELVEYHKKGPKNGHVWDRMLVRQGPWKSAKGDVLPMPFQLRVPAGTAVTGRDVNWELRGYVDINWAFDIEASSPIMMKNVDLEHVRDALGHLDYRIVELEPQALGQRYFGKFQPPPQLRSKWGVSDINLDIEYLGANLSIKMEVEKTSLFKFDKKIDFLFDLGVLRSASKADLAQHFQQYINQLMGK
ncbi:MAG: hypothetical protein CVU65_17295 [Deltaproteobacteria bacterium HGW-Deltaproteobacteria-22]|jgi:hypothetical protein|nr:MAG: hypothetical protein CVU65_17295 [Deltaproteobacteria bacterium HGW-Deltaproteobacteria-22]